MKQFGLAIGLAAIDGLTCAFVGVLVLALILIGSGDAQPTPDWQNSYIVMVEKSDPRPGHARMNVKLLMTVSVGTDVLTPADFTVEAKDRLTELPKLARFVVANEGGVAWHDCTDDNHASCESMLFIVQPIPNGLKWKVRLRMADTISGMADDFPPTTRIRVKMDGDTGWSPGQDIEVGSKDLIFCPDWQTRKVSLSCG